MRILFYIGGIFVFFILFVAYFFNALQPTFAREGSVSFVIEKGQSFRDISAHLSQESLIKSIFAFKMYSFITGNAQKFKPGTYEFSCAMTVPEIVSSFIEGKATDVMVTIPEGLTMKDADSLLAEKGIIQKGSLVALSPKDFVGDFSFLKNLNSFEGFVFPDTYRFEKGTDPQVVLRTLLKNFEEKIWPLISVRSDWYETLITASLLEREVVTLEDKRVVAGIIKKRIEMNMPIQIDASIVYAKCNKQFLGCASLALQREDMSMISPYNTYIHKGLPPSPISNPGVESVTAALSPQKTKYLYYISRADTKQTIFSSTLDEHNKNIQTYLH